MILYIPIQIKKTIQNYFSLPYTKNCEVTLYAYTKDTKHGIYIKNFYLPTQVGSWIENTILLKDYVGYIHYHPNNFNDISPEDEIFAYNINTKFFLVFNYPFKIGKIYKPRTKINNFKFVNEKLFNKHTTFPINNKTFIQYGFVKEINYWVKYYFNNYHIIINKETNYIKLPIFEQDIKNHNKCVYIVSRFDLLSFPIDQKTFSKLKPSMIRNTSKLGMKSFHSF